MKKPMGWVHDENHANKWRISDEFGLKTPGIQKPFQTKSGTSTAACVSLAYQTSAATTTAGRQTARYQQNQGATTTRGRWTIAIITITFTAIKLYSSISTTIGFTIFHSHLQHHCQHLTEVFFYASIAEHTQIFISSLGTRSNVNNNVNTSQVSACASLCVGGGWFVACSLLLTYCICTNTTTALMYSLIPIRMIFNHSTSSLINPFFASSF